MSCCTPCTPSTVFYDVVDIAYQLINKAFMSQMLYLLFDKTTNSTN
jgi:hypothetical protein